MRHNSIYEEEAFSNAVSPPSALESADSSWHYELCRKLAALSFSSPGAVSTAGLSSNSTGKYKQVLRGFVGLSPEGLDVNVQAKRTKGAKAP